MAFISVDDFKSLPTQSLQLLKESEMATGNNFLNGTLSNVFSKESTQKTLATLHTVKNKLDAAKSLKEATKHKLSHLNATDLKNAISTLGGTQVTAALNAGQNMAISTISNVTGAVGNVVGSVTGTAQVISGRATMIKDVTMLCVNKLVSYCAQKSTYAVTDLTTAIVTFPIDVATQTAYVFGKEFTAQSKSRLTSLLKDAEDLAKVEEKQAEQKKISDYVRIAEKTVGDINAKVTSTADLINSKVNEYMTKYVEMGPDKLASFLDKTVEKANGYVGTFIDKNINNITKFRNDAVDDISKFVGGGMATEAVDLLVAALSDKMQKAQGEVSKAKAQVAILKRKAIISILALLGK